MALARVRARYNVILRKTVLIVALFGALMNVKLGCPLVLLPDDRRRACLIFGSEHEKKRSALDRPTAMIYNVAKRW